MGRIAPATAAGGAYKGMTLEVVTVNGNWSPPDGVTEVHMELNGAGNRSSADAGTNVAMGQAGDIVNAVVRGVSASTIFAVVIGSAAANRGVAGGSTTVTVQGVTRTAVGGGHPDNKRGAKGAHKDGSGNNVSTGEGSPVSLLLGRANDRPSSSATGAAAPGFGGNSPLGNGSGNYNQGSMSKAGIGAGGTSQSDAGDGYVIFGYFKKD